MFNLIKKIIYKNKNDYLNLRLTRREKETIIKFTNIFIDKFNNDTLFKDENKKYTNKELNLLESKFGNLFRKNNVINPNYYNTKENQEYRKLADNVYLILYKKVKENEYQSIIESEFYTVKIEDISRLYIETILYLNIIEKE